MMAKLIPILLTIVSITAMAIVERIAKPFVEQKQDAVKVAELAEADALETKAAEIRAKYS